MVTATVREWHDEEGWGVLDSPETPGGCWGHFSHIQVKGFRTLSPGQQVDLQWEAPGFKQDGYSYRAVNIDSSARLTSPGDINDSERWRTEAATIGHTSDR
ncbi:hypothetical protein SFUMM280S_02646 [Streptomyces fumanus]